MLLRNLRFNWKNLVVFLGMAVVIGACAQQTHIATPSVVNIVKETATPSSEDAVTSLHTQTILLTENYATVTAHADKRSDSYLMPADIDGEVAQLIQLALETRLGYPPARGEQFFSFCFVEAG